MIVFYCRAYYSSHANPLRDGAEWSFADENRTQPLATTKYQLNRKLIQRKLAVRCSFAKHYSHSSIAERSRRWIEDST